MKRTFLFLCLWPLFSILNAQRLVLPGDHPDPSVVKIGDTYWASATTSNWMPAYPLLKSKDLLQWETAGTIFQTLPAWADYYFWAPEITYDNGRVYVYYSAHKKGGNLCVGIASADRPEGPYKDHGPIVCQTVGSIDAFPIRDENGKLFMVWKEDGNSVGKPTPIWMQELNEERTKLLGEKKEMFRNNAPWEGNLVEGVSIMKHNDYYYAFYAAAGCCGDGCTYQSGVARAKSLSGPWEKYAKNPILKNEGEWKCPGHGTPVEREGKFYFLYHAYKKDGGVFTGRQGLMKEFRFTPDAWIEFIDDAQQTATVDKDSQDEFSGREASEEWQWIVFQKVKKEVKNGNLELFALPDAGGAVLGRKMYEEDYDAMVEVNRNRSTAASGIGLIGDEKNSISALIKGSTVQLLQLKNGKLSVLSSHSIGSFKQGHLKMQVRNGKDISFYYGNRENNFTPLNKQPLNGSFLPPWDRALRIGLVAKGPTNQKAVFEEFEVDYLSK